MIPGFTMHADSYDPMAQHLAENPANGPVAVFVSADRLFHLGSAQGRVMTPDEVQKSQIFELEYADPSAPSVDPERVGDFSQPTGKAAEIAEAMNAIQKATQKQTVDVVAHSAGCTDFRAYLESRTGGPDVNRAVLVGPASHGTAMGNVGEVAGGPLGLAEGGKELAIDSPLVNALNQRWDHQLEQVSGGVTIVGVTGAPTPGANGITDGDGFMTADTVGMPGAGLVMLHGLDPTPVAHLTEIGKGGVLRVVDGALGAP
jgi:pimeloyl-ACP methyl ester carboxylesterase